MKKKYLVISIVGVLSVAIAGAIFVTWPEKKKRSSQTAKAGNKQKSEEAKKKKKKKEVTKAVEAKVVKNDEKKKPAGTWMLENGPGIARPIADYLVVSRFPPHSRPLDASMTDLLFPNRRYEAPRETRDKAGKTLDATREVLFTGDKHHILGEESIALSFEVIQKERSIPAKVRSFTARARGRYLMVPFTLQPDADNRHQGSFAPGGTILRDHFGFITFEVTYDVLGTGDGYAQIEAFYQPAKELPGRFTGQFREELVKGSLVIYAGVSVDAPGAYVFDANIFDAADAPTAFARAKVDLKKGESEIAFTLFGRVVREKSARSPFTLRNLRGYRFQLGRDPDRQWLIDCPVEYRTRAYALEDFSPAEFWNDAKQKKVDRLASSKRVSNAQDVAAPP